MNARVSSARAIRPRMKAARTATATTTRPRRTQAERTAGSRLALLEAAAKCLCERGFSGTTVAEIAKRAEVSLGCLQHHFPAKNDLLANAVEHVFEQHRARLLAAFAELPETPDRSPRALDLLWEAMQGEAFIAYLELVVGSRTDRSLRRHVERTAEYLSNETQRVYLELFPPPALAAPFAELVPVLVIGMLEGVMLGKIANPKRGDAERAVAALKQIFALISHAPAPSQSDPHAARPRQRATRR